MSTKPLRVACINAIVTEEGDLIVAGTPGRVLHRIHDPELHGEATSSVMVEWDAYLFVGDLDDDVVMGRRSNTGVKFIWETTIDNLRYVP